MRKKLKFCKDACIPTIIRLVSLLMKKVFVQGCLIHEEKDALDWNFRLDKLKKIVKLYKSKSRKKL